MTFTNRDTEFQEKNYFEKLFDNSMIDLLLNSIHDGILITDKNGIIKYVNRAYSKITCVKISEVMDKDVSYARKGSELPNVLKTGVSIQGIKRMVNEVEYIANISPICVNGKIIGAVSIIRDVTEVEQLYKKLNNFSSKINMYKDKVDSFHKAKYSFNDIIGENVSMKELKILCERISTSNSAVLIQGDSGTGKELFAHSIHNASLRQNQPFVAVNCAALPSQLLLSELFGYDKGAFTGASKSGKLGLFEVANNGTLFLDEIGDMDIELQAKILRVLETGEFYRIGGTKPTEVNVRIVSATNKDLKELIDKKKFREDLYYRLNVVNIKIPPLKDRLDDIPILANFILNNINRKQKSNYYLSDEALNLLSNYSFPGNVRELDNILKFSLNMCVDTNKISPDHLPKLVTSFRTGNYKIPSLYSEKELLILTLKKYESSVQGKQKAAKELGISLATLYNKIKQYQINTRI